MVLFVEDSLQASTYTFAQRMRGEIHLGILEKFHAEDKGE